MITTSATRMNKPYTAAVVTLNREKLLKRCIQSLINQEVPPSEIYIVDQGRSGHVQDAIKTLTNKHKKIIFTYVSMAEHNRSIGRNHVLNNARYRYVLFTDDDCVVRGDWAKVALRALMGGNTFVHGNTLMHPTNKGHIAQLEHWYIRSFFSAYQYDLHGSFTYILDTRNCAIDIRAVIRHNLTFDRNQHYLEDVDFSYQICQRKEKIAFEKKMVVYHQFRSNIWSALLVQFQLGRGIQRLNRRWSTNTQVKKISLYAYHKQNMRRNRGEGVFSIFSGLFLFARWMGYCFGTIGG